MKQTVGVAELRQNLSRYLRRVEQGERLLVSQGAHKGSTGAVQGMAEHQRSQLSV